MCVSAWYRCVVDAVPAVGYRSASGTVGEQTMERKSDTRTSLVAVHAVFS
jgi:hypothetical protein